MGGNRVSLCVSMLSVAGRIALNAVTAGGSQAIFFKINTLGEDAFLEKAVQAVREFCAPRD